MDPMEAGLQLHVSDAIVAIPEKDGDTSERKVKRLRHAGELLDEPDDRFSKALDFKVYSLQEMVAATDNFHPSKLLGQSSNGQVFEGVLQDGNLVAVKRLPERSRSRSGIEEEEEFVNEIRRIGAVNHRNIMELLGFCLEGQSPLLVSRKLYSLHTALYEDGALEWDATYNIAIGVAKGLSYLHTGTRRVMVHCDIKPGNIMLDPHTLQPYIADFGIVHLGQGQQSQEGLEEIEVNWYYGSQGYRAPEVRRRKRVSVKSDVYSYGKLLYALISAQKDVQRMPPDLVRNETDTVSGFSKLILKTKIWLLRLLPRVRVLMRRYNLSVVDERLKKDVQKSERKVMQMAVVIRLIMLCTQDDPGMRPSMERVLVELESGNMCNIPWSIKVAAKLGFRWYWVFASLLSFLELVYVFCCSAFIFFIGFVIGFESSSQSKASLVVLIVWICAGHILFLFELWTLPALRASDELLCPTLTGV